MIREPITVAEAARELGVSERRVRALLPRLIFQKIGVQTLIERSSLENVRDRKAGRPRKEPSE